MSSPENTNRHPAPMRRVRIGMLTPSSNTVLEPMTQAMLAGIGDVSVHFSRFPVTEIALSAQALSQFDEANILAAARLLADARVDVIAWNGTSSSWLGFAADVRMCDRITAETGIPATTAILALNEALARVSTRRLGLVSPYTADVQARIIANYAAIGIDCIAERCLGLSENFAFADVTGETIEALTGVVAPARPDAIAVICTNMAAAPLVSRLEQSLGIPVFDTVATTLWRTLAVAGVDPRRVRGWGGLFDLVAALAPTA
jgi:maleate isomerase